MDTTIISVFLIALVLWFVWRVFKFKRWFQLKPEPPDEVRPGDVVDVREPAAATSFHAERRRRAGRA